MVHAIHLGYTFPDYCLVSDARTYQSEQRMILKMSDVLVPTGGEIVDGQDPLSLG
jgi:hypothetical protein